jgi:hypothetical protein
MNTRQNTELVPQRSTFIGAAEAQQRFKSRASAVPSSLHGNNAPFFNVDLKQKEKSQGNTSMF